jgi:hypothetical protein
MAATDDGECMQYMHEQQKTPLHKLLLLRKGTGKMAFTSNKLDVLEPTGDVFQLLFKVYCNAAVKSHTYGQCGLSPFAQERSRSSASNVEACAPTCVAVRMYPLLCPPLLHRAARGGCIVAPSGKAIILAAQS